MPDNPTPSTPVLPSAPATRFDPFVLAVLAAVLALLIGWRVHVGAGFGGAMRDSGSAATATGARISTGILFNFEDNLAYITWAQQASRGRNRFMDLFTTEPHGAIYINPFFWVVGRAARWTGASVFTTFIIAGLIGAALVILLSHQLAIECGFNRRAARWAVLLIALGAGLSGPLAAVGPLVHYHSPGGQDVHGVEAFGLGMFFAYPYHTCNAALMCIVLLCAVRSLRPAEVLTLPRRILLLTIAGVVNAVLAFSHPHEPAAMFVSFGLFAVIDLVTRRVLDRRLVALGVVLALSLAPAFLYSSWVSHQPVWRDFAASTFNQQRGRGGWLVGYGLFIPAAILGTCTAYHTAALRPARWLACWAMMIFVLLLIVATRFSRVSNGGIVPIGLTAGLGWSHLLDRLALWRARNPARAVPRRLAFDAILLAGCVGFFSTSATILLPLFKPFTVDPGLLRAARTARAASTEPFPTVLCDDQSGSILAAAEGCRVYCGTWSMMTPDYDLKQRLLITAGMRPPDASDRFLRPLPAPLSPDAAFAKAVREANPAFLILNNNQPAADLGRDLPDWRIVEQDGQWLLFAHAP